MVVNPRRRGLGKGGGASAELGVQRLPSSSCPGVLNYLNYAGMWSQASFSWDRQVSYWRWASRLSSGRNTSGQSDSNRKSSSLPGQGIPAKPP